MCCGGRLRCPCEAAVQHRAYERAGNRNRRHSDNTRVAELQAYARLFSRQWWGALPFRPAVGIDMTPRIKIAAAVVMLVSLAPFCVASAQAPTVVGAATEISGVVKAGSPIQRILQNYKGLDDPIGLRDGTLVFSEPDARRLHRLNTQTNEASVLVAESTDSHGTTQDSTGRLISAQALDGSTRIGVIYPPGRETVLADKYDGMPFSRPNDLIVAKNGGIYFTDPGLTKQQAEALVKRHGGAPLGPRLPPAVYYIPPGQAPVKIEGGL